jgi:predicted short-subunit dehydrogenase-like oxidoreductase (DUF2520 family)
MAGFCYAAARMVNKPTMTIVGPGRLGSSLARALHEAGYAVGEIVFRSGGPSQRAARTLARKVGGRAVAFEKAKLDAPVTWLCVGDSALAACAAGAAGRGWKGRIVLHTSGALAADVLSLLRGAGAAVASVHPMMSFVHGAATPLAGVVFALEGDARALRQARAIVKRLGGRAVSVRKEKKPLYHAFGAFTSPLLVAVLAAGERVAAAAGLSLQQARAAAGPILEQTLRNFREHGAAAAFSGPLVRGDVATVRMHLEALRAVPEAREAYVALVKLALRTMPVRKAAQIRRLLEDVPPRRKPAVSGRRKPQG